MPPPRPLIAVALSLSGLSLLLAFSITGAADVQAPKMWQASAEACGEYAGTSTFGFCLQRLSAQAERLEEMVGICAGSGEWEVACRVAWVRAHIEDRRTDRDALLAGCGADPDCNFVVTDLRPIGSIKDQLDDCAEHVRPYLGDCAGHTLRRFHPLTASPELPALLNEAEPWMYQHIAAWAGVAVGCGGPGSCDDAGPLARDCAPWRDRYAKSPASCPSATPLHTRKVQVN